MNAPTLPPQTDDREPVPAEQMAQAQRTDWSFLCASWEGALTQEQAS